MNLRPGIALLAGVLSLLSGCATLDTSNMSPACRGQYNACVDGCGPSSRAANPIPQNNSGHTRTSHLSTDTETPSCVDECNRRAKSCT